LLCEKAELTLLLSLNHHIEEVVILDADSIVIGSGSGGLTAAVALAQAGDKVLVLEQHEVPGGWCHSFTRGGHHFSPGVHYIGQLEAGQSTALIYEGLGVADDLQFFELNPDSFEQCFVAGQRFDFCRDVDKLQARFQNRFPADAQGIADYFFLARQTYEQIPLMSDVNSFRDLLTVPYRTRHLGRYGFSSLKTMLEKRVRDPLARAFLSVQVGDHGLPPRLAPFGLHCGVMGHYFNGGYYPVGGGISIPLALRKSLKKHGGEIRLKSKVSKIILDKNKAAIGVELSDGSSLRAKRIISNADPNHTYNHLVGRENLSRGLKKKLDSTRYSMAAVSLFFAVDVDVRKFGMNSGNVWYMRDMDFDASYDRALSPNIFKESEFDGLFVTALSLKDPTQYNGRHHTMEAVTFVGYDVFREFENSQTESRTSDYLRLKAKMVEMMLRTLERAVPGLTKHIVFSELGTPTTSHHFINATDGSCYGTEKTRSQMGPFAFRNKTEIKNLFICGASTSAHGVSGAANSGLNAAASALECKRKDLLKKTGQSMRTYLADQPETWPEAIRAKVSRRESSALEA
jgi:all-trans-retinol 13,14-reductase